MNLGAATPAWFLSGTVDSGLDLGPVTLHAPGYRQIILGADVYPGIQPNNGSCQIWFLGAASEVTHTLFQVQQSANFPGPFMWRGFVMATTDDAFLTAHSTVPFAVSVWGLFVPDFTQDNSGLF